MIAHARPAPAEDAARGQRPVRWLRGVLLLFALVVVVQAGLGFVGLLGAAPAVITGVVIALAIAGFARRVRRDPASRHTPDTAPSPPPTTIAPTTTPTTEDAWTRGDAGGLAALLAAFGERAWTGLHRTTFLYDVLSYHLHLPAAWRAAGRLQLVPTPFGDPAPAYTPSNAELVYHLALAATGNATLAHAGQIPFAVLAALAIHATARVLGATRATGFVAALAFLLIPEVWQQAPTAMADLALVSFFLAAIPFLLRLERRRAWPDLLGLGLALGLLAGTKYVAVVMSLPLVAWTATVLGRRRTGVPRGRATAAVVALVFVCGGFWYVRNAILTGNPLYPATLRIGSITLARGLFDGAATRMSPYHVPIADLQALLEIIVEAGWGTLAALALAAVAARRSRWPTLALVTVLLAWFVIPYQQSRFFFPLWGTSAILLAVATTRAPRVGWAALLAAGAGSVLQFPTPGRLGLLAAAAAGALVGPRLAAVAAPVRRRFSPAGSFAVACALAGLPVLGTLAWARARARTDVPPYRIGDHHDEGWDWMRAHVLQARVAYTGSNLPLPLWGPRFENQVHYVNISGGPRAAPHDFLVPVAAAPLPSEPQPERQTPDQAAWLSNLDALRVEVLFVVALYPGLLPAMAHDAAGFPVERAWADALPDRFSLAFANPEVRIYRHRRFAADGVPR